MTAQQVVDLLNEAVAIDGALMHKLVEYRVRTHNPSGFLAHPTIVPVALSATEIVVGMLGIINGIVGIDGFVVAAEFSDDAQELLLRFSLKAVDPPAAPDAADVPADAAAPGVDAQPSTEPVNGVT